MTDNFSFSRLRRLRNNGVIRGYVSENSLDIKKFVYPLFIRFGVDVKEPISSMPGCFNISLDHLKREVEYIVSLGITGVLLFGIPEMKDAVGSDCYSDDGIIQEAIKVIKDTAPDLYVITDICLCEYTDHGHCGIVENGVINNDETIKLLGESALTHVQAGADMVAPSAMMDGQVKAIRSFLDAGSFTHIPIMGYSAKYSSAFYGPFREAADSTPSFGDRKAYQMDPSNRRMALEEVESDIKEGADIVMVKPALSYLDVIHEVRHKYNKPVAAYNVSGDYSLIKAAAEKGWVDEKSATLEVLTSISRAGADMIISYHAKDVAQWLA